MFGYYVIPYGVFAWKKPCFLRLCGFKKRDINTLFSAVPSSIRLFNQNLALSERADCLFPQISNSSGFRPETSLRKRRPFSALALGGFLPLLDGGTVWAVALVFCPWYEIRLADLASLLTAWLHDLGKQLPVCGKDCIFEIVAVDPVPADALRTRVLLAVIQQQTVAVYIVAAELFNEGVDLLWLLWRDFYDHVFHLLTIWWSIDLQPAVCSECRSCPGVSPRRRFASVIAKSYPIRTVIQFSRYNEKVLHLFPLGSAELSGVFEKIFLFCKRPLHLFGIERLKRTLFFRKKAKNLPANIGGHTFNTKNIIGLLKYSERIHISWTIRQKLL